MKNNFALIAAEPFDQGPTTIATPDSHRRVLAQARVLMSLEWLAKR